MTDSRNTPAPPVREAAVSVWRLANEARNQAFEATEPQYVSPGDRNSAEAQRVGKARHERSTRRHDRAAALHEAAANFHEKHAVEMDRMGYPDRVERAERIADRERVLAEQERTHADYHRRQAAAEPSTTNALGRAFDEMPD